MSTIPRILVVDDEPGLVRYMRTMLELDGFQVETASSGDEAVSWMQQQGSSFPDLVILDVLMPGMDGLQTLEKLREVHPRQKVVMLSCVSDTRKVVQAIRLGAHDYLTKPFQKAELDAVLAQCLPRAGQTGIESANPGDIEEIGDDMYFIAACPAMRRIRSQVRLVSNVDIPVLMLGESGTGKEVVARLVHKWSSRAHRTFMKVNCAAVPADLLESELFGFEAGAFTGAVRPKPGKFELCNKGTLLLDEIGEMPTSLQAKLLHVLQDQQFSRLGSRTTVKVDVRILAATNIDVEQAIATRRLREDLYYRLNAFTLKIPPLRERKEEIPLLLRTFMTRMAEQYARPPLPLTPKLLQACTEYEWPGNLRQLGNFVKRYLVLGDESLAISELGSKADLIGDELARSGSADLKAVGRSAKDGAEMDAIARTLETTNWNRKEAAVMLKISYKALLYKIRQYGLEQPASRTRTGAYGPD